MISGRKNPAISHIVLENDIRDTAIARRFARRFPGAAVTVCPSAAERAACTARVGPPKRVVYLARRRGPWIKTFPSHPWYGADGGCRYNLILGYNCTASCRYCFVQTIFDDPIPTIFADSVGMADELHAFLDRNPDAGVSTGEYIDSLLFDDVTRYTESLMAVFSQFGSTTLELRTKSTQTDHLPEDPIHQVLVSYSINPPDVVRAAEPGTPGLGARLGQARRLSERGYRIGLRIDPVVPTEAFSAGYRRLPAAVERHLGWRRVSRVFLGVLRFDAALLERMSRTAGGRRLLDAEYVRCPDGYYRPSRHARIETYRRIVNGIRRFAPAADISVTMEPNYVQRAVLDA
ncbi:MAG: hypothetical protein P8181_10880 [bacterium]